MKNLLKILSICFFNFSCISDTTSLKKIEKNNEALTYLLSPKNIVGKKQFGVFKVSDIYPPNDSIINKLKKEGLVKENSEIYYTSLQCISLVTRIKEKLGGGFLDYVISNNLNESDFGCNLNSIYSPVQDEEITKLKILVRQTNSFITFIEVEGD
jgi:hypothetical protein